MQVLVDGGADFVFGDEVEGGMGELNHFRIFGGEGLLQVEGVEGRLNRDVRVCFLPEVHL